MLRFCPKCRVRLQPIKYKLFGKTFTYLKCDCGWTNKPENAKNK